MKIKISFCQEEASQRNFMRHGENTFFKPNILLEAVHLQYMFMLCYIFLHIMSCLIFLNINVKTYFHFNVDSIDVPVLAYF